MSASELVGLIGGVFAVLATIIGGLWTLTRALNQKFSDAKADVDVMFRDSRDQNSREHQMVVDRLAELSSDIKADMADIRTDIRHLDTKIDEGLRTVHARVDEHLTLHVQPELAEVAPIRRGRPKKVTQS